MPSVSRVDLDLDFEPGERSAAVKGEYTFFNHREYAYERFPITAGPWDPITWTLNGESYEPEDRSNLFIFTPAAPLAPGDTLRIGFEYDFVFMEGMSQGPGGAGQFILESGIVLTAFGPTFVPVPGYLPGIGVDGDNSAEPRERPDDFYEGETEPLFGWGGGPFTVRTRITTPEAFTANAVGQLVSDEVVDGRRTVVWETDHPVTLFNVIAGRYDVIEGDGTAIYHHPEHDYNIEEMSAALDAARRYYSEWFYPFPWDLLKISEFPDYAGYAQGFPTNITFSEGIGFLADSDPVSHVAFMVVAHESAHQWWGNLLVPGDGPGGNILSEGMSHYATMLLHEQVYGDRYRMEFGKRIESRLRPCPIRRRGAAACEDGRQPPWRRHRHVRQARVRDVDAPAGDGPRQPPRRPPRLHRQVQPGPGLPGAPGHARRAARLRSGLRRVRDLHRPVVLRRGRPRVRARGRHEDA